MDFLHNTAFLLPLSALVGVAVGYYLHRKFTEYHRQNIEDQGKRLLEHAILEAEQIKKEAQLQCKNEIYELKQKAEEEKRKRESLLLTEERRLAAKLDQLEGKIDAIDRRETKLHAREKQLDQATENLKTKENELQGLVEQARRQLERVSGLTVDDAKKMLMSSIESEARMEAAKRLLQIEQETKNTADKKAKKILALAISRYAADFVMEKTVSIVPLPNDEMKGRIIGREGRNIRAIEAATGIDIIIDDTPEAVVLSGFDPVRRETARLALEQLILDGRIHPARIEEVVEKAGKEVARSIHDAGEQATFDVGVHGVHEEIIKLLGRLKFRTSFTQNVLQHSLEVAFLCGVMASELGLDSKKARRAGLLHDIGKAVDHEIEGSHAVIGRDIARKYGEAPEIVYAIGAHHEDEPPTSVLDILVKAADALSGARPGARKEMLQTYVKRLEGLEKIANSFGGVEKSYAIQAGRDLRIIVNSDKVKDSDALLLSKDIARQVEEELTYPGQIKVTVIRETRAVEYAQ